MTAAEPQAGELIVDGEGLERVCASIRAHGVAAFDTEFHGERLYYPKLFLVQIATPDLCVAIDPLEVPDLDPLVEVLADPAVETIVHAGEIDLSILLRRCGRIPARVFDTQVAAGFVGLTYPMGLGKLVDRICDVRIAKGQTLSDWSERPLRPKQIAYALEDVRHLIAVRAELGERLASEGRADWFAQEMATRVDPARLETDPERSYLRVSGWGRLRERERAIVWRLAAWRERTARELDKPVQQILDDRILTDLARAQPTTVQAMGENRRIHKGIQRKFGEQLLEVIAEGQAVPDADIPPPPRKPPSARDHALANLLGAVLRVVCHNTGVAMELVAPRELLREFVQCRPSSEEEAAASLGGWRAALLAAPLFGFLSGRRALALDPETEEVRFLDVAPP